MPAKREASASTACRSTSTPARQSEATVTEHIRRLRPKIEADPDRPRWVTTSRGVGSRFEP